MSKGGKSPGGDEDDRGRDSRNRSGVQPRGETQGVRGGVNRKRGETGVETRGPGRGESEEGKPGWRQGARDGKSREERRNQGGGEWSGAGRHGGVGRDRGGHEGSGAGRVGEGETGMETRGPGWEKSEERRNQGGG